MYRSTHIREDLRREHSFSIGFGVTYKEDKPFVVDSIKKLKEAGEYPDVLWG